MRQDGLGQRENVLYGPAANDADQQEDDGDDQEDVKESAERVLGDDASNHKTRRIAIKATMFASAGDDTAGRQTRLRPGSASGAVPGRRPGRHRR